jgi:CubicO group peptidase (beta-lactamase class C family)
MKIFETPMDQIEDVYAFFQDPSNMPLIQVASDKTHYVWQHFSNHFHTEQVLRDGPISELPERKDPAIGGISVTFEDGTSKTVDDYFDTSTMDAMLVLREGNVVYERYKTMRPLDKHIWFSCSKTIEGTLLAMLEHEGKVDVSKPVTEYVPELAGSEWDTVTVEETADMATGLDSTEHEVPDARTNPARGWYQWAVSIGLFEDTKKLNETPIDVLKRMKREKPGHTVFEYNSINTFVCQTIVENVTGVPLAELFAERFWRRIGAQGDGYIVMNKQGHAPWASAS